MFHKSIIKSFKVYWVVIFAYLLLFLSRLFSSQLSLVIKADSYLIFHIGIELFSILVSFSIALQCFASYPYTKSERKIFLGVIFTIVGLFDLVHTLTYQGMPLILDPSRATYFWVLARMTEAFGILFYVCNFSPQKRASFLFGTAYFLTSLIIVMGWGPYLPPLLNATGGVTPLKVTLELITCLTFIVSLLSAIYAYQHNPNRHLPYLICAFFMVLFSELVFALYTNVYDLDNILGHIYKFIGYAFILRAILVININEPFEKMRASAEYSSLLFQFAPVGLLIIRRSDNQLLQINLYLKELFNLKDQNSIGKTPVELGMNPVKWQKIINTAEEITPHKDEALILNSIEIPFAKEGYPTFYVAVSATSITFNNEKCLLMSMTNITELKQLHAEMTRLDRFNLVGQLAAGIAHEIRNPMTTVRGYLQLMGEKTPNEAQKSTFNFMIEELDRANGIITEYLSLAKNNKTSWELLNLNELLLNLYPLIEADAFNRNNEIRFIQGDIPKIELNPNEITQVVLNLCRNGLEAMPNGGCLTIRTYAHNGQVVLAIKDEGQGIPSHILGNLGTPFFTTKEKGTGLGLAICYKIAHSHHGRIDVDSSSKGTEFRVSFPITLERVCRSHQ